MDDLRTRAQLIEAFQTRGCAICRIVFEQTIQHIDTLNYECVMDPDIRAHVKKSAGFCAQHAPLWNKHAAKLATAQIYGDILDRAVQDLKDLTFAKRRPTDVVRGKRRTVDVLSEESDCLICTSSSANLAHLIKVLNRSLSDQRVRSAFDSGTICFDHGRTVLATAPDIQAFEIVRNRLLALAQGARADLAQVVRKHDHRFSSEEPGKEVGSGERAIRLVVGEFDQ
jgi:hypothetical protein